MSNTGGEIIDEDRYVVISGNRDHDSDSDDAEPDQPCDRPTFERGTLFRNPSTESGHRTLERNMSQQDLNPFDLEYTAVSEGPEFQPNFSVGIIFIVIKT